MASVLTARARLWSGFALVQSAALLSVGVLILYRRASRRRRLRAFVWRQLEPQWLDVLCQSVDAKHVELSASDDLQQCPAQVDVVVLPTSLAQCSQLSDLRAAAPNVKALIKPSAGISSEQLRALRDVYGEGIGSSIQLHNLHHNAAMTAEMAIALLLTASKFLLPADARLRCGDWRPRGLLFEGVEVEPPMPSLLLSGRTALVLGLGSIGSRVSRVLKAFGMEVMATRRSGDRSGTPNADGVQVFGASVPQLRSLLPKANVLIVCLPATAETIGVIGQHELQLLPPRAILVNVGRAQVVDEEALFHALCSGRLFAAGIDVWYQYPVDYSTASSQRPSTFDFASLPNVVMSPHRGGGMRTDDAEIARMRHMAHALNEAVRRGLHAMPNRWSPNRGY